MIRSLGVTGVLFLAACSSNPTREADAPLPEAKQEVAAKDKPVTFNFQRAELETVFELLSRLSGMNIIYDAGATAAAGPVTLSMQNVPAGEVLDAVVKTFNMNLVYSTGNTVRVVTSK